jgi:hypothetical protein
VSDFGDRLDRLYVRAEVPGITGVVRDRRDVVISFTGNTYYRSTESDIGERLVALCRLLWVAWIRGYYEELSAATGQTITTELPPANDRDRQFRELREQVDAQGSGADGRITVRVQGLHALSTDVRPGTLAALTEEQFVAGAREAVREMLCDYQRQIAWIRGQVFTSSARRTDHD